MREAFLFSLRGSGDCHRTPVVMDDGVCNLSLRDASAVAWRDPDYAEGALRQHAWETAAPLADCQSTSGLIPLNRYRRVNPLLVVVIVALIFVEREQAVRSSVDTQLDGIAFLRRILNRWAVRDD